MLKLMDRRTQVVCTVKKALHKYRVTCMQANVASLEKVVSLFVYVSEKRTENAHKLVNETILEDEEALEDGAIKNLETLYEAVCRTLMKQHNSRQRVALRVRLHRGVVLLCWIL